MARELPIHNGRMTTDLDANGFKIKNLPPGSGFAQAQADWNQADATAPDFIKNKPTIPAVPTLATVATSGSYNDLTDKPTIPAPVSVDATLTQSGAAADAKATGDALAQKRGLGDMAVYAPSDFSEWTYTVSPALPEGAYISIVRGDQYGFPDSYWAAGVEYPDGGGPYPLGGDVASTSLTLTSHFDAFGPEYTVVFTRTVTAWTPATPADTLAKTSQLPTVPSAVSAFTNDAGYITAAALPYPFVSATPSGTPAVLTVTPRTVATFTATSTQASFSVAVGTGVSGAARDCVLVVDCMDADAVVPTVTWPSNFHPRGDAEEMAPVADVRNVFYISEYATGEFVVGGWHEEVA